MKVSFTHLKDRFADLREKYPAATFTGMVLGGLFLLGVLGAFAILLTVGAGVFGELPKRAELRDIRNAEASEIYDARGQLLGRYLRENRTFCAIGDMPKHLLNALVATEDSRFYQHAGIDYQAWGRVAFKNPPTR